MDKHYTHLPVAYRQQAGPQPTVLAWRKVIAKVQEHWGTSGYTVAHYNQPADSHAIGYVLFQISYRKGAPFIIGVRPVGDEWFHAHTFTGDPLYETVRNTAE